MKNPYKIIHKFKNNNGRIQYQVYIFIGPIVPDSIIKILDSFSKKDFYNSIISLNKKNLKEMEDYYGETWYNFFFLLDHIAFTIRKINTSSSMKKIVTSNLGKEWYDKHINVSIADLLEKKIPFSFSANYQNYLISRNKIKSLTIKKETNFQTYNDDNETFNEMIMSSENQVGGNDNVEIEPDLDEVLKKEDNEEDDIEFKDIEELDDEVMDDFNLDELMKLYSTTEMESNKEIKETSKLISKAINDKSWEKKADKIDFKYKDNLDNNNFDAVLEQVFNKVYITSQYIFEDDTIKNLRMKISNSIPVNPKFGEDLKLLPEYQYFWSEYTLNKKRDKIMLGQKWIRRNELLKIDIKPNENLKVYENLRDNLNYLRDSFGYKIKREDDENLILRDYEDYITNNEIYMLDLLNDLGLNYSVDNEKLKNLYDVYINIYFPLINYERLERIVDHLNNKTSKELEFNSNQYLSISNDTKMEKEIYQTIENARIELKDSKYQKLYLPTYILQSIIHVNILDPKNITGTISDTKFNLYRIFDNFIVDEEYPFLQYMSPDSQITYKFYTESPVLDDQELLTKWFENSPYGLNFKIKIPGGKFISIGFAENGRIEYKITWKEDDEATIDNINESYTYVRNLIKKINTENKKIKIMPPINERFKYAFINTIQKFNLPENFKINHNDLSEFSRLFFPYISLVIEPKKRVSKKGISDSKNSKYGTYLRYKRISNYENVTRMHLRILYFLRNYDLSDRELIDEIAKQFNITSEVAAKELDYVKDKYSKVIKKSKKILKKLKSLPKSKAPGIGIDIQRREAPYKIRITGARNKKQLTEIVEFMKILTYLYSETYLYKKSKFQKLKSQLSQLSKVAKRRNKVIEIVDYESPIKSVKALLSLDKSRLSYRPEEGQNQYSRNCQNSGNDKKRRPLIVDEDNISELLKRGFKLNKENGYYEKEVEIKVRGKTSKVSLKAVKLLSGDSGKYIYFACEPDENKKHMYIGFLSRGNNPSNLCAPCCFKKDQLLSDNKKKRNYFLKCVGNKDADDKVEKIDNADLGDKIYILQDTNKIQEGRFIYLPKYLDYFFNKLWNNDHIIKNHYLIDSKSGYFFKYTVKDNTYFYLAAIANIFSLSVEELKNKMIDFLKKDTDDRYFTYLNNGDIREIWKEKDKYIQAIKDSNYLEYDQIGELLSIPGVVDSKGLTVFVLEKRTKIIKRTLEKDTLIDRYFINCLNDENYFMINEDRNAIILVKEGKYFFPIYKLKKDGKKDKKIILTKIFNKTDDKDIYDELINYFNKSCINNIINKIDTAKIYNSKNLIHILEDNKIEVKLQLLDIRNKVRFIKLKNNVLVPVTPAGSLYNYPIEYYSEKQVSLSLKDTIEAFKDIEKKLNLKFKPTLAYFDNVEKNNVYNIVSMNFQNKLTVPTIKKKMTEKEVKKFGLDLKRKTRESEIDDKLIKTGSKSDGINYEVKIQKYNNEAYNLFRLELSLFLSNNESIKEQIVKNIRNKNLKKEQKKSFIRSILFTNLSNKLKNKSAKSKNTDIIEIVDKVPDLTDYNVKNVRDYCKVNTTKEKCNVNLHCLWASNDCKLQLKYNQLIEFINKVIEEMILNNIQFKELIQESNYFVSDIADYNLYTARNSQKIVKTTNFNIKKIMSQLFGKDKLPTIGRKKMSKKDDVNIEEDFPEMIEIGDLLKQPIIKNMDSVIRAYVNSLYWLNNKLYDIESRNLGYLSDLQTQITYLLKAKIIDFVIKNKNNKNFSSEIKEYFSDKDDFFETTLNKFRKTSINTSGVIELLILSYVFDTYPIIVYNNFNDVIYIFDKGNMEVNKNNISKYSNIEDAIKIQFDYEPGNDIPSKIYSIYTKK